MNRRTLLAALGSVGAGAAAEPPRFSVQVRGKGPDLVLIPGLASSGAVWDETTARLAASRRIHVVTVAGFAGTPAGPNATGPVVEPLAAGIGDYIAHSELGSPAVIGHSLGGFIGLWLAVRRPGVVGRVMTVDALPFYSLLFNPAATVAMATPFASQSRGMILGQSEAIYRQGQGAVVASLVRAEDRRPQVLAWSLASDRAVVAQAMYDVMTTDLRPELSTIKAPVTALYAYDGAGPAGRVDALWASAYAAAPSARLKRIDRSRHFMMLDQPGAFAAAVDHFLA